jgi:hypothetical protein
MVHLYINDTLGKKSADDFKSVELYVLTCARERERLDEIYDI